MVNISKNVIVTQAVYLPFIHDNVLRSVVEQVQNRLDVWMRFQSGTTQMQKYRKRIKTVLNDAKYTGLDHVETKFVYPYVIDTLACDNHGECGTYKHTLLPGVFESASFQKALSDYADEQKRRMEEVIQNATNGLADASDGSELFKRMADFVLDQLKAISLDPKTEVVVFASEEDFEALLRKRISRWPLKIGNFDCEDPIHAWCNVPLPESIRDLVNGLRACFFMQFDPKHANGRFQHLHAIHGKKWLAYCDVLEALSSDDRMQFAMRVSSLVKKGKRSDDAIFEELCKAHPDLAKELKMYFTQPMQLFKNDSVRMSDLFF